MSKQTRGRPKKNQAKKLPQIYRTMFTQHDTVCYGLSLMYVMEIFAQTKSEKRIGHSQGSFTSYERVANQYCYDTFDKDVEMWGSSIIFKVESVGKFSRRLVGMAPKIVLRELILIVHDYMSNIIIQRLSAQESLINTRRKYSQMSKVNLDKEFKYLRYTQPALVQLRQTKNCQIIFAKVNELWPIFLRIFTYCIYCSYQEIQTNKYLKPLFSDAAKPEDTLIGQLTLKQIYEQTQRDCFDEAIIQQNRSSCSFVKWSEKEERYEQKVKDEVKIENEEKYDTKQVSIVRRNLILVTQPPEMRQQIKLQQIMQTIKNQQSKQKKTNQQLPIALRLQQSTKIITKQTINSHQRIQLQNQSVLNSNSNFTQSLSLEDQSIAQPMDIEQNCQNQKQPYKRPFSSLNYQDQQKQNKKIKHNTDQL